MRLIIEMLRVLAVLSISYVTILVFSTLLMLSQSAPLWDWIMGAGAIALSLLFCVPGWITTARDNLRRKDRD